MIHWLQSVLAHDGYGILFLLVFLNELCLPSPGDKTMMVAGFLVGKGDLSLWAVIGIGTAAGFLGCALAYWSGRRMGNQLLLRIKWLRITPDRLKKMEGFFEKYGAKTVFYARFVALLHPITGLLAGIWKTPPRPFLLYNLGGTFANVILYTLAGRFLGHTWELHKNSMGAIILYLLLVLLTYLLMGLYLKRALRKFFKEPELTP